MRSYIFTRTERQAVAKLFEGILTESDPTVAKVKHRVKRYTQLREDVELYLKLAKRFKQSSLPR